MTRNIVLSISLLLSIFVTAPVSSQTAYVHVAIRDFPEQEILFAISAEYVRRKTGGKIYLVPHRYKDYREVERAMVGAEIDVHWSYTSTIANYNSALTAGPYDADQVYQIAARDEAQKGIELLAMSPLVNDYVFAVRSDNKSLYNLLSLSDLKSTRSKLSIAVGTNFKFNRVSDGLNDMLRAYDIRSNKHRFYDRSDKSQIYRDLRLGTADIILVFKTDQEVDLERLRLLDDDRGFFPPYNLVPTIRRTTLNAYPELGSALNDISLSLNNDVMRYLLQRYQIDGLSMKMIVDEVLACESVSLEPIVDSNGDRVISPGCITAL